MSGYRCVPCSYVVITCSPHISKRKGIVSSSFLASSHFVFFQQNIPTYLFTFLSCEQKKILIYTLSIF